MLYDFIFVLELSTMFSVIHDYVTCDITLILTVSPRIRNKYKIKEKRNENK